ncbi:MAG: hypothetical protein NTX64_03455 [Elusimicrobia bacterium]|nr:hypothetical protein [Elusimicrobiota bacterium]
MALAWAAGGNPAQTVYELQRSTGGPASTLASQSSFAFIDTGLAPGTSYFYQVRAVNGAGLKSAFTPELAARTNDLSAPVPASAFGARALDGASIEWSWTPHAPDAAGYRVMSGTSNLSGDLAAAATTWVQSGLQANLPYGAYHVQAFNAGGLANSGSASRYTLAGAPSSLSVTAVSSVSASLAWSGNDDPDGTIFELERSAGASFVKRWAGAGLAAVDAGLSPSTAYSYRVRAVNGDGIGTAYAGAAATAADPGPPAPMGLSVSAIGDSALLWTWTAVAGASQYRLYYASNPTVSAGVADALPFVSGGLAPNTLQRLVVSAVNATGEGLRSAPAQAYTLADPPALAVADVEITSAAFAWSMGSDPPGTPVELLVSTDGATFNRVFQGIGTSATDYYLLACLPAFAKIRAINGDGLASDYSPPVQLVTQAQAPLPAGRLSAMSLASDRIRLQWSPSPSEGVTGYKLYYDAGTGQVDYVQPLAELPASATGYLTDVLVSSPAYRFSLRAVNRCGVEEQDAGVSAAAAALNSLDGVRAAIATPEAGKKIIGNRITVQAQIVLGDVAQTRQVLFQYKPSSAAVWAALAAAEFNHPNPASAPPWYVHWNANLLAPGSYDLRALATDFSGRADATPPAITVGVDPAQPDIQETDLGGGSVQTQQKVNNGAATTVQSGDAGSGQLSSVAIPAGALASSTVTITVVNNPLDAPAFTAAAVRALARVLNADPLPANDYVEITLDNGQSALVNGMTAAVSISYPDADNDGIVDGTGLRAADLQMWAYDPVAEQWRKDFLSTVDAVNHRVTGNTPHFSLFGLFAAPAHAALNEVQIYPVPFKPNGGNPDEGRPFSPSDPDSGIVFNKLPPGAVVTIYTVSGRRVKRMTSEAGGRLQWDARNEDGRDVATGGYIAVMTSQGQVGATRVLAIIR